MMSVVGVRQQTENYITFPGEKRNCVLVKFIYQVLYSMLSLWEQSRAILLLKKTMKCLFALLRIQSKTALFADIQCEQNRMFFPPLPITICCISSLHQIYSRGTIKLSHHMQGVADDYLI